MAREELGTKRVCPETGKKFYDLNKDPIVSPYSGKQYPVSYFQTGEQSKTKATVVETAREEAEPEDELEETGDTADDGPEFVSLEEADDDAEEQAENDEDIPEIPDVDIEVEDDDDGDDDAFLDDEDEDDDLSNVIGEVDGEEEV